MGVWDHGPFSGNQFDRFYFKDLISSVLPTGSKTTKAAGEANPSSPCFMSDACTLSHFYFILNGTKVCGFQAPTNSNYDQGRFFCPPPSSGILPICSSVEDQLVYLVPEGTTGTF